MVGEGPGITVERVRRGKKIVQPLLSVPMHMQVCVYQTACIVLPQVKDCWINDL